MATEAQKFTIRNIRQEDLISCMLERMDIDEIVKKFRTHDEFAARDYMKVKDFAKYLDCSEAYVRDLIRYAKKTNAFNVATVGTSFRIDRISYDKWVSAGGEF